MSLSPLVTAKSGLAPQRILVIEDCHAQRRLLERRLRPAFPQRTVLSVGTAAEAVAQYPQFSPHLVLCDVELPGACGLELVAALRLISPEAWFVVMSATDSPELREQATQAGANEFLCKVSLLEGLDELVQRAARNAG